MNPEALKYRIQQLSADDRARLAARLDRIPGTSAENDSSGTVTRRLVAWVETSDSSGADFGQLAASLRESLKQRLPRHMVPDTIVPLIQLPRLPNGKVDTRALVVEPPPTSAVADDNSVVAPQTPAERQLADIWSALLNVDEVSVHDNFFEHGGDSIISIQFISRAREAGLQLDPQNLVDHPTIGELAAIARQQASGQLPVEHLTGRIPLTPIQHWFFNRELVEPAHWNQSALYELLHPVDESTLQKAVEHCVATYDIFRLRFEHVDGEWVQELQEANDVLVPFESIRLTPIEMSEGTMETIIARQQAGLSLESGHLTRFVLIQLPDDSQRLLIVLHHLLVDVVSWGSLVGTITSACQRINAGVAIEHSSARSYGHWCQELSCAAELFESERDYWTAQQSTPPAPDLPANPDFPESAMRTVHVSLDAHRTEQLNNAAHVAHNTQTRDLLVAASTAALCERHGSRLCRVGLESHGRDALTDTIDVSETVGWMTGYFPILFRLPPENEIQSLILTVKETLRRIPGGGVGYGVLRYLIPPLGVINEPAAQVDPQVLINYVGTSGETGSSLFRQIDSCASSSRSPRNQRSHALEINAAIRHGQLEVDWLYDPATLTQDQAQDLAGDFLCRLEKIIDFCVATEDRSFTASDFPEANMNQSDLDEFLDDIG